MYHDPEALQQEASKVVSQFAQRQPTPKEKAALPVMDMPSQKAEERIHNMQEVALGYTEDEARAEAMRCLQCKAKPCIKAARYPSTSPPSSRRWWKAITSGQIR
jgi:glutamate synthase (NADPH/NADH) small chain